MEAEIHTKNEEHQKWQQFSTAGLGTAGGPLPGGLQVLVIFIIMLICSCLFMPIFSKCAVEFSSVIPQSRDAQADVRI